MGHSMGHSMAHKKWSVLRMGLEKEASLDF